jgi:hypothetical protein
VRNAISLLGALALILFPIGSAHLSSMALFGVAVAVSWFVLVVQIVGMLPRPSVARSWEQHPPEAEPEADVLGVDAGRSEATAAA